MLEALSIRDLAIIDHLELAFERGLTVITGETGAGKSILIRAVGLVLGERARTDLVRSGAKQAQVQAQFNVANAPEIRARLDEAGLDDGDTLIVRRQIMLSGRHRIFINGSLVKLAELARITPVLLGDGLRQDVLSGVAAIERKPVSAFYSHVTVTSGRSGLLANKQAAVSSTEIVTAVAPPAVIAAWAYHRDHRALVHLLDSSRLADAGDKSIDRAFDAATVQCNLYAKRGGSVVIVEAEEIVGFTRSYSTAKSTHARQNVQTTESHVSLLRSHAMTRLVRFAREPPAKTVVWVICHTKDAATRVEQAITAE